MCVLVYWILFATSLAPSVLSSLHPDCEYIFQLEREERRCLRYIAEQNHSTVENSTVLFNFDALQNHSMLGCLPFWDSVVCWPYAAVGETFHMACPAVFSLFGNNTAGSVSRNCTSNGWSRPFPPYHIACSVDDNIHIPEESYFATVKLIYSIGYGTSLFFLSIAVVILLLFRRLRCARNYIHIQLFVTFMLKAMAVFNKDAKLFASEDTDHCSLSTAACKASVVFCHYCVMANFFWLLVEALYLNSLLLSSFHHSRRCLWGFGLLGWGVPIVFIVIWIGSRVYFEDTECWDINEDSPYWWIIKGPIVVSIGVNFILFMNIIRILIQKLNPRLIQFNNSDQYRRLTKSTLLLIPLFGSHYMVFNFLPDYFQVSVRLCIELCMGSFQGLIVAILYCFLNQEVQKEIHMRWLRWQDNSYGVVLPGAKGSQMDTPF
ncbi:growth hormone-releasing hormone receptor isoform X1 [Salmo salar]|uniref:Growth hormone-releasing hormone receptor isoform X1 n=1 Tax=Salmo salar TaxID=8030 RepID=A0A1S3T497_SALSA|nr:growth hormone-releasing hormone receptor isoform X1 [Salmo salar]|eukprot:XP_014071409.1 PREDICTED: growth hormone-releasing hormone receptor-like isoform X4 [Salmo salar]